MHTAHKNWVLYIAWSPDGKKLASGGMDNELYLWDPQTGKTVGKPFKGHKKWVTCISWEPFHLYVFLSHFFGSVVDDVSYRKFLLDALVWRPTIYTRLSDCLIGTETRIVHASHRLARTGL